MKRRTKIGTGIFLAILAVVGLASIPFLRPHEPFSARYRVLSSLPWMSLSVTTENTAYHNYAWLDNERIVYTLPAGKTEYKAMRQRVSTKQIFPAEAIPNIAAIRCPNVLSASPNGKWLITDDHLCCLRPQIVFYSLDGSKRKYTYSYLPYDITWLPDGTGFIGREDYPRRWSRISLKDGKRTEWKPEACENFRYEHTQGFVSRPILERYSFATGKNQVYIESLGKTTRLANLITASPLNDKLLWCQVWCEESLWNKFTAHFSHKMPERTDYIEWFVTDTKGKNRRRVAAEPLSYKRNAYVAEGIRDIKWLPDGKHLSAVYNGALYVVPVP